MEQQRTSEFDNILFIGFNQDCGEKNGAKRLFAYNLKLIDPFRLLPECFMCVLESVYRIYNTDPLKENAREGKCSHRLH